MTASIQSLGGKARAANMTPEERTAAARHAATKGARKLGKEGRRLRALKGVAARKARAEAAQKWGSTPEVEAEIDATFEAGREAGHRLADNVVNASGGGMFSAGAQQLETLGSAVGIRGGAVNVEPNVCTAGGFHGADVTPICRCSYADPAAGVLKVEPAAKPRRPLPKAGTAAALVIEVLRPGTPLESQQVAHALYYATKLNVRNTTEAYALVKNALSSLRSAGHVVSEPKPGSRREKLWRLA